MEEWKDIPGLVGFQASNSGQIRNVRGVIKGSVSSTGYLTTKIYHRDGPDKTIKFHRLVCAAFYPKDESRPHVNHKDGNKLNNNPENLEWCSHRENVRHRFDVLGIDTFASASGKHERAKGSSHGCAKLDEAKVREIKSRHARGESCSALGKEFGVNRTTIHGITTGRLWRHV